MCSAMCHQSTDMSHYLLSGEFDLCPRFGIEHLNKSNNGIEELSK